jgi:hypothetical protein
LLGSHHELGCLTVLSQSLMGLRELLLSKADLLQDLAEQLLGRLVLMLNHLTNDFFVSSPVLSFEGLTTGFDHRLDFSLCLFACCGTYELQQFEEVLGVDDTVVDVFLHFVEFLRF